MSKPLRTTFATALAALILSAVAPPAWAEVPSNDTPTGAIAVLPGQDSEM